MPPMHRFILGTLVSALGLGCVSSPSGPVELSFPHEAVRIDGVCKPGSETRGLSVSVERPYARSGVRRFRIVNAGGAAKEVHAQLVASAAGRCDQSFSRWGKHGLEDLGTCRPPAPATLAPGQSLEMRIQPSKERFDAGCTKIGLALYAEVDGEPACVEMGSWLVQRPTDD
jgi:hypothetical protein